MASRADLDGGYVLLFRRLLDNPVFRTPAEAMAFAYLIMRASWAPVCVRYKGHMVELKRGQLAISVRDLGDDLEWSKDRVSRFLNTLAKRDMITTLSATGVNVITICKYDDYQRPFDQPATLPLFEARQDRDRTATQNNEDNELNEREESYDSSLPNKRTKRGTQLPEGWVPSPSGKTAEAIAKWPPGMLEHEIEQFTDYHRAKGTVSKDWEASFRTWARNADDWKGRRQHGNRSGNDRPGPGQYGNGMVRASAEFIAEERARSASNR